MKKILLINLYFLTSFLLNTALAQTKNESFYEVSTFVGSGSASYKDGTGEYAKINDPNGMCKDSKGNLYLGDRGNQMIRKISPSRKVTTLAGGMMKGYKDEVGSYARFNNPAGLSVDSKGNVYVCDEFNHCIRKITPSGKVTTFAGNGRPGFINGIGQEAFLNNPLDLAIDKNDNLFVLDYQNNCIRKITSSGSVSIFAGSKYGYSGSTNAYGKNAKFNKPLAITIDKFGNLYVVDAGNEMVRKITPSGQVSTVVDSKFNGYTKIGKYISDAKYSYSDGSIAGGICVDKEGVLYLAVAGNNKIYKIDPNNKTVEHIAGSGYKGSKNGDAEKASFNIPVDLEVNDKGDIFVCDARNNTIRKISKKKSENIIYLSGTIVNQKTKKGLEATFTIENKTTQEKYTYKATSIGKFNFEIFKGQYKIFVNYKGYMPYIQEFEVIDKSAKLNIELEKIEKEVKASFSNIQFKPSSYELLDGAYTTLKQVAEFMKNNPNVKIQVNGHTDKGAGYDYNLKLSTNRAKTVVDYLILLGVNKNNLSYKGFGNTKPIATNSTVEGRKKNRRIEFEVLSY